MTEDIARTQSLLFGAFEPRAPYEHNGDSILSRRRRLREAGGQAILAYTDKAPKQTVSAFADWVLRQYAPPKIGSRLAQGKAAEFEISAYYETKSKEKRAIPGWTASGWELVQSGLAVASPEPYRISSLLVDNLPLLGVPDLVYRHRESGRILIVEIKVTSARLPADGWPNLRAQLWAYSKIDSWAQAPEVILAGEVWSRAPFGTKRLATYRWTAGSEALERECQSLFLEYGGTFAPVDSSRDEA